MPMIERKNFGSGSHAWLGSAHGTGNAQTGTLNISAFTDATHFPNGYIPSGTPVNAADLTAVTPYVAPTEGEPALNLGFILDDTPVSGGVAAPTAILRHASIVVDEVPGDFAAPAFAPGFIFE